MDTEAGRFWIWMNVELVKKPCIKTLTRRTQGHVQPMQTDRQTDVWTREILGYYIPPLCWRGGIKMWNIKSLSISIWIVKLLNTWHVLSVKFKPHFSNRNLTAIIQPLNKLNLISQQTDTDRKVKIMITFHSPTLRLKRNKPTNNYTIPPLTSHARLSH